MVAFQNALRKLHFKKCLVPGEGIEPSLSCLNWILNPARLPVPPPGHISLANLMRLLKVAKEI